MLINQAVNIALQTLDLMREVYSLLTQERGGIYNNRQLYVSSK